MRNNFLSNVRTRMEISEVMTSTVYTSYPDQTVAEVAKLMTELRVGSIILEPREGERTPLGIITERDIVTRVVAAGLDPSKVTVDEVATRPVVTAPPTLEISEAMTLMSRLNIRRIVIVENNNVIGICTDKDLLRVAPSLLEIALEIEKITMQDTIGSREESFDNDDYDEDSDSQDFVIGFYCSHCGEWYDDSPIEVDDQQLCENCFNDREIGE